MKPRFLDGLRIADLTWAGAGPFGTKIFSDFGAEVVKVESVTRPDSVRVGGPFKDGQPGINRSGYFASRNTGKKSLSVDLKTEEGYAIVCDLIRCSDVVSNNFGPDAMERLGLGYDAVRAIKADIVYLSMPMYGDSGPRAAMLGVGMTIGAVTGMLWQTAYGPDDPVGPGTHYPDHAANPYHAAFAVLAALRYRRLTGEGMKVDLSQVESTINFLGPTVVECLRTGTEPPQLGNRTRRHAPQGIYRCTGEDEWCAIAIRSDAEWAIFADLLGHKHLAGQFPDMRSRVAAADMLDAEIETWTVGQSAEQVARILSQAGIAASRVMNARTLIEEDKQLAERDYWQRVEHPELGNSLYASPPYRIDGERVELSRPPLLGEHNKEVLAEILGYSQERIAALESGGVLR